MIAFLIDAPNEVTITTAEEKATFSLIRVRHQDGENRIYDKVFEYHRGKYPFAIFVRRELEETKEPT